VEKNILRLLIVDDSPDDAEVVAIAVRKAGYMLKNQRVQDIAGLEAALAKGSWDLILCEHAPPQCEASQALDALKRAGLDIPFIVVARRIAEEELVRIMRAGALDVIEKTQLFRLPPVIERELRVFEERQALRKAEHALQETQNKHRAIVDGAREAICYCQDGMHIDANRSYLELFGYGNLAELEGVPVMNLIDKGDQPRFKDYLRKAAAKGDETPQEFAALNKDGGRIHVEFAVSSVIVDGEPCTQVVANDVTRRKTIEGRLQYLNQHDPLTGLYNRHYFLQALGKTVEQAKQGAHRGGLLYIGLTQLKEINDVHGHATGDRLIVKIAKLIRERLGEQVLLARFGGDEFAALLDKADEPQLKKTADDIRGLMKETAFSENGKTFHCGCTFGTAVVDRNAEDAQKLLSVAYRAALQMRTPPPAPAAAAPKADIGPETKPQAVPETKKPQPKPEAKPEPKPETKPAAPKSEWAERIQAALDGNAFELAYQPIINLHGEAAECYEVLLRLPGAGGKLILAAEFLPAAEQAGLGGAIDKWVVHQSLAALCALHREGQPAGFFINLSAASFKEPEILITTQKLLREAGVAPEHVTFEVAEKGLTAHLGAAKTFLAAAKKIGCRIAIDDFAGNPSAFSQLRDLPFDSIKVSAALIRDLANDKASQASLQAVIQVARGLSKGVIVKCLERAEDLAILWNLGVDYVQGNYFQGADTHTNYEFADETTLSSEPTTPHWASTNGTNGR